MSKKTTKSLTFKFDGVVKSQKTSFFVIPAPVLRSSYATEGGKAGIQRFHEVMADLDPGACPGPDPGFAGVTTSNEVAFHEIGHEHYNPLKL